MSDILKLCATIPYEDQREPKAEAIAAGLAEKTHQMGVMFHQADKGPAFILGYMMAKEKYQPRPSGSQQQLLRNLAEGRPGDCHVSGRSQSGAYSQSLGICYRRGWVDKDGKITDAGLRAIGKKAGWG